MQAIRKSLAFVLAAATVGILIGCQVRPDFGKPRLDPEVLRAEELAQSGDPLGAAELYRQAALRRADAERDRLLLLAAENYLAADMPEPARRLIAPLESVPLPADEGQRLRLLQAELLLSEGRGEEALDRLATPPPIDAATDVHRRYYRILAEAHRQTGRPLLQVEALQTLDVLQPDPAERLLIQQEILHTLLQLDEATLRQQQSSAPDTLGGWTELAVDLQRYQGYPRTLAARLDDWRAAHPEHPALPELLDSYLGGAEPAATAGRQIAILLPVSGRYAKAAAAIRDGFLAAWYLQPAETRPPLRFYDSSNPEQIWPIYSQAVEDGAFLVVGPLDKSAVAQLVHAGDLPVPVLSLNRVDSAELPPANLFQFSLSPEDEARQVAEHAWVQGLRSPVLLTPLNDWGNRLEQAFGERWAGLGGSVADQARYDPNEVDHTRVIRELMGYREREVPGRNKPQPERRTDIDFIFIAAKSEQAQQIRPQLLYFLAGDLPVYATSHAWPGQLTSQQARDMAGILIPEIPWVVEQDSLAPLSQATLSRLLPASATVYGPLYAMGIDAYQLLSHLNRLQVSPAETLAGKTGILSLNERNQVQRQMIWLRIDKVPQVLDYTPWPQDPGLDATTSSVSAASGEQARAAIAAP